MIEWNDFSFTYPSDAGIRDVCAHLDAGEAVLLCGPSGGGKTTLLRSISGIVPQLHDGVAAGTAQVAGLDTGTASLADVGAVVGNVFQDPKTAFFTTRVRDELAFGAENVGIEPNRINARIDAVVRDYGIEELADRGIGGLSAGERQRVACACTAVTRQPVICLDEPTSNLDLAGIAELADQLAALKAAGRTLVIAEHRVSYLRGIVDRVYYVADGRVRRIMPADEFWAWTDEQRRAAGVRSLVPLALPPASPPPGGATRVDAGLVLSGLRFERVQRLIIDVDALSLPAGRVHALVGPNGSGKTTLARLLSGLERPAAGRILLNGAELSLRDRRRRVALVMHELHRQVCRSSVAEELSHVPDLSALLHEFALDGLADRHPLSLSGGQLQRLVVAAAVAGGADALIFDEPTSGLDYPAMRRTAAQLRRLADQGRVVLVISHDPELIRACADRVIESHVLNPIEPDKELA